MTNLSLLDIFPFGPHQGETVYSIIVCDPGFIQQCFKTMEDFSLDPPAQKMYEVFRDYSQLTK